MAEIDFRIVRLTIEVDNQTRTYESKGPIGFDIKATGSKYANQNQNEADISISNLDKATQNYILTQTSPFNANRTPKRVVLEAGRISYGTSVIFVGNITNSSITQPPDTTITLKCLTGNFNKGNIISQFSETGLDTLSKISQRTADSLNLNLDFQATNKNISNYYFSGGALDQVDKLVESGNVDAYVDDNLLVVKDAYVPLSNRLTIVNANNGMVGIPEFTEQGIRVMYMLDGQTVLGGALRLSSQLNPAVDGDYVIYKLDFNIASRAEPFYWIAEAKRL